MQSQSKNNPVQVFSSCQPQLYR
ncbi:MAG: hypothetical protein GWP60_02055 [Gammaproteobacteria bacterium]|nr:hypothetical protein [Gammaproteobacteria bacterium]